jgi:Leucine-rich repeat (LRR) protein
MTCLNLTQCAPRSSDALGTVEHTNSPPESSAGDAATGEQSASSDGSLSETDTAVSNATSAEASPPAFDAGQGGDTAASSSGSSAPAGTSPVDAGAPFACDPPTFRWASLEAAIREIVGVPTAPLTATDLEQVTKLVLYAPHDTLGPLAELTCLTQLSDLTLSQLGVTDIQPLSALTQLRTLDLGVNEVSDVSALSQLPLLTELVLAQNRIESVASLILPAPPARPDTCGGPEIELGGNPLDSASVQHLCDQGWYVRWGLTESDWQTCNAEREVRCPPRGR